MDSIKGTSGQSRWKESRNQSLWRSNCQNIATEAQVMKAVTPAPKAMPVPGSPPGESLSAERHLWPKQLNRHPFRLQTHRFKSLGNIGAKAALPRACSCGWDQGCKESRNDNLDITNPWETCQSDMRVLGWTIHTNGLSGVTRKGYVANLGKRATTGSVREQWWIFLNRKVDLEVREPLSRRRIQGDWKECQCIQYCYEKTTAEGPNVREGCAKLDNYDNRQCIQAKWKSTQIQSQMLIPVSSTS